MNSHDVERAWVQARIEAADRQLERVAEQMQADLDRELTRLRESWNGGAELVAASEAQRRADHQTWLRSLEDEEPLPPPVAGDQAGVSAGPHAPASPALGPQQPNPAAGLTADDIKGMSLSEYGRRRAELGVQSVTDMSRLGR